MFVAIGYNPRHLPLRIQSFHYWHSENVPTLTPAKIPKFIEHVQ